jgi:hypothetical protein
VFIGHYAVSYALKSVDKEVSLGTLFLAVQFVDILFFPLTLLGIERFRLLKNFTQSTHFDLQYMPYSHSLLATFFWGLACLILMLFLNSKRKLRIAAIVAIAVMSHWFLDLLVHTPDLPISIHSTSTKVGFGLWNHAWATYLLEAMLLVVGLFLYFRSAASHSRVKKIGMMIFAAVLLAINWLNIFGELSATDTETSLAITTTIAYLVIALIAYVLDYTSSPAASFRKKPV